MHTSNVSIARTTNIPQQKYQEFLRNNGSPKRKLRKNTYEETSAGKEFPMKYHTNSSKHLSWYSSKCLPSFHCCSPVYLTWGGD